METDKLTFFPDLTSEQWSHGTDIKVRNELMHAHIPYIKLPSYMETDIKTCIIGTLKAFVFFRARDYWICEGKIPGKLAINLTENYNNLYIQTGIQLDKEISRRKLERPDAHISRCSVYTEEGLKKLVEVVNSLSEDMISHF